MRLSDHQAEFTQDLAHLIRFTAASGRYRVRLSYAERSLEEQERLHRENPRGAAPAGKSQHNSRLAADLILDRLVDGRWEWQSSTAAYQAMGVQWETMSIFNRWGGRFSDGNHFERLTSPRREPDVLIA